MRGFASLAADARVWLRPDRVKVKQNLIEPVRIRRQRSAFLKLLKLNYRHAVNSLQRRAIKCHSITPIKLQIPCDRRVGR
jgi:hypothetical protein